MFEFNLFTLFYGVGLPLLALALGLFRMYLEYKYPTPPEEAAKQQPPAMLL